MDRKQRNPGLTPPRAPRGPSPQPAWRLPWWKKLLYSALTLMLFFTALELVLWACGVKPALYDEDPYVGFSGYIPLFIEETRPDGVRVLVTARNKIRFFNPQEFPATKDGAAYRIFCMGESTTYGHPYDDRTSFCRWLRELLPAADSSRQWEVINAGGISYASYRVALLMEELIRYQPDLFIVYVGHNEFLERRTYSRILEMPAAVRGLGSLLSRTRTYTAMHRLVHGRAGGPSAAGPSEAGGARLPAEVEAILDTTVGPAEYTRDDALREQVLAHYRFNIARMIDMARSAGAKVILVTPASNLRDFEPFKSEHRAGLREADLGRWEALLEGAQKARRENRLADALRLLDEAAAIDDRHAHLSYLRGKVLDAMGRYEEARAALVRARDEDICPLRALSPVRQILLDVAAERDVPCVDFMRLVEGSSAQGIPGNNLFLDHVHPTIEGHRRLALSLLEEMVRRGAVRPGASWGEGAIRQVTQRVEGGLDREAQGLALKNLAKTLGWAGKFEEARKLGERAEEMLPGDAEVQFNLGDALEKQEDLDKALEHYQRALRLEPGYPEAWNKLGRVLEKRGNLAQAALNYQQALLLKPDYADAQGNLGNVLANQGNLPQAVIYLEKAVRLEPRNAEALHKLGLTLSKLGKLAEAEARLRAAIDAQPGFFRAQNNLGLVLAEEGKTVEAAAAYEEALRLQPSYARAHDNLGNLFASQGRIADAAVHFGAALRLEPNNRDIASKLRAMAERFEAALSARPTDAEAHHCLGLVLEAQGKRAEAEARQEEAIRVQPGHARAHYHLALLEASAKDRGASAALHFREALRGDPGLVSAARGLAWLLATHPDAAVRSGPEAVLWAERAARAREKTDPGALETLAAAFAEAGRYQDAARAQATAVEALRARKEPRGAAEAAEARLKLYQEGRPYRQE